MKSNSGKYRVIERLPNGAKTVRQYAEERGIHPSYVYKMVQRGKNDSFEIVLFQGINFVINK